MASIPTVGEALLYLRSRGLRRTCGKLLTGYLVGRACWYLTIENLRQWVDAPLDPQGLELRPARHDDVRSMDLFTARQHRRTLARWCDDDHFLYIALHLGQPIAYRCLSRKVHADVEGVIRLRPHQLFVVDEYTAPAFRRRGITRALAIAMNPMLIAQGFSEVVGVHRTDNQDTIAATRRKNIRTLGRLTRWRLAWRVHFTWTGFLDEVPPLATPPLAPARPGETRQPARAA